MSELEQLLYRVGIPEEKATALRERGIYSVEGLLMLTPSEISQALGISKDKALELLNEARRRSSITLESPADYFLRTLRADWFTTGCTGIDRILGGGIRVGRITEFVGEAGVGKTQIAHQLCVTVQLPRDQGGLESGAIYLDSEGSFRPERIAQISKRFKVPPHRALKRILHARARSFAQQYSLVLRAKEFAGDCYRLLIVDPITSLLRREYPHDIVRRQQALARLLHELRTLASKGVSVIITNTVISDPVTGELRPAGGLVLEQAVDTRVFLSRKNDVRIAEVVFSVDAPTGRTRFRITREGVVDA